MVIFLPAIALGSIALLIRKIVLYLVASFIITAVVTIFIFLGQVEFFAAVDGWFGTPSRDFLLWAFDVFFHYLMLWKIHAITASIDFAYDYLLLFLAESQYNETLQTVWQLLPAPISSLLLFCGITKAINILIIAYITRFILKFLPFV